MWVEYLDESHFIRDFSPGPTDWRYRDDVFRLPTAWVLQTAQRMRLKEIHDSERRTFVREYVASYGLDPLTIVLDMHGRVVLEDGHHRLLAARDLGIPSLPIVFKYSEQIRVECGYFAELLVPLLVGVTGIEPARTRALVPKTSVST